MRLLPDDDSSRPDPAATELADTDATLDLSHPEPAEAAEVAEAAGDPWEHLAAYVALPRLGALTLAPDGQTLVAAVSTPQPDGTAYSTALWRVDPTGQQPARRLTRGVEGESAAAFLRDGSLVFTAKRAVPATGADEPSKTTTALWCLPPDGGEAYVLARRDGGWEGVIAARGSELVVLAVSVHAGAGDEQADAAKRADRAKKKVAAILHDAYPVRFWDRDLGVERTQLLSASVSVDERGEARMDEIVPLSGDVGRALAGPFAISDDGRVLVTGWREARPHGEQRSTVAWYDLATGERQVLDPGEDELESPVVSPDGSRLVCVRSTTPTPERAPDSCLHVIDLATGAGHDLAPDWDRWPTPVGFSPDGQTVYAVADEDGDAPVFAVSLADGSVSRLTGPGAHSSVVVAPDGTLYAVRASWIDPGTVVRIDPTGAGTEPRSSDLRCLEYPELPGRLERVETTAADGARVPGYLLTPHEASAPSPLLLWIHGGPLNSWNSWSWRWCPWLMVSRGYAVLLPDPALSTGYGYDYIQRGWGRWGAEPYTDLMALTDAVVARPDIDESRTAAMGGSFGGYMANWVAGHTDRFKAIVTHASLWNLESFGHTTDAAWYWAHEMSPQMQREFSPHRFADAITTPMLVVHGDRDYRVPIGEGLALWWALCSHHGGDPVALPHRFLYFPDESHWVLTPQHAQVWYETVRSFLDWHVHGRPFVAPALV